jgi:hypothetical protein
MINTIVDITIMVIDITIMVIDITIMVTDDRRIAKRVRTLFTSVGNEAYRVESA